MVATISAIGSSAQASSYYEADDYYADGGLSPSEWQGEGAKELGLAGEVERDAFRDMLDGRLPDDQQLGTTRDGKLEHRPGWDVTMSAPKSVSIMAEVAGDRRLVGAHDRAVKAALAFAERHASATRIREDGKVERHQTGNLVVASFLHDTSRAQDPQLHTHNVIMNMTRDADGNWRSLEPRAFYQLQKAIGAIYRQELAVGVRELGYEIETSKDSLFEIKGVSPDVIRAFSERAAQVEARLAERGQTRETASAEQKQIAALDTREAKQAANRAELVGEWRATADHAGFGQAERQQLVKNSEANAANTDHGLAIQAEGNLAAQRAVTLAAENLGERQSVFSAADLEKEAGRYGMGKVTATQIGQAIVRASADGALVPRSYLDKRGAEFAGFTTATNIENERRMLRAEVDGRGVVRPIHSLRQAGSAVAKAELRSDHRWNSGQRDATRALLTSTNRVIAVQGYAGTAKTTTVLATFAAEAKAKGLSVTPLAPTASAARTLSDALGMRGATVAKHLLGSPDKTRGGVWIVDEASMLSARDMTSLLELGEKANARIVLVGDVKQLGSVDAGAAFKQLQDAGMQTAKLDEIVRQTNVATKDAVQASIEGDARKALAALDRGGGTIFEHNERTDRFAAIARAYASLNEKARARTLVIEPSREGRDALTAEIRTELAKVGALTGPAITMQSLVNKGLSRAEARDPASYERGDLVRFTRDYADKGVARAQTYRVEQIDPAKAAITLKAEDGRDIDWRLRQWGASKVQAFSPQPLELKAGDRIQFTRNDRELGRINGGRGTVSAIDQQSRTATIRNPRGQTETLNLENTRDQHIRHAYVETAFAAQGRTADRVMIHADSKATNLVDQKSFYVSLSRAKESVAIYTNDREKLVSAISERAGLEQTASEQAALPSLSAGKSTSAGLG
ncbi:MobF family relaxase [Croceicoccus sp. Ery15]|uniref:MobF family relaxase n=1 Tax=Croceicoccus sp. Ery15 TaxID=1703338 RepID=UPI001E449B93|nr:MobF family relaxase [Croceicoccus sp. Ery15]